MESKWVVVGIGGVTCGGKTTIANELQKNIPNSAVIHQDDYYYPMGSDVLEYVEEVQHYNWDTVTAVDSERMINDVKSILASPASGTRILFIEGSLIFNIPMIGGLCSTKYFVTASKETCRYRRRTRKYKRYDERYFDKYVWPSAEHYIKETFEKYNDITILDGELSPQKGGVVIVEGTLVLNIVDLQNLCDFKYYLTLPYEISKDRRYRKHYEIPDPPLNFDKIVWPNYLIHKSKLGQGVKFVDSQNKDVSHIVNDILTDLSISNRFQEYSRASSNFPDYVKLAFS